MQDIPFRSAKQLASLIRRRKIGCLELLDLYLARMARHNPRLNAIVVTDVEALDLQQIGDVIFRLVPRFHMPIWSAFLMIDLLIAASIAILERRVRGIEVVA